MLRSILTFEILNPMKIRMFRNSYNHRAETVRILPGAEFTAKKSRMNDFIFLPFDFLDLLITCLLLVDLHNFNFPPIRI